MPSSDPPPEPPNPSSNILSLRLKQSYEERLKLSKSDFSRSLNRLDVLKRNLLKRPKNVEKPSENPWITSGPLGSRDAVLVFRTTVLNAQTKDSDSPATSGRIINLESSTSSIEECEAKDDTELSSVTSPKAKVLTSLPKNCNTSIKELKNPSTAIQFNRRLGATKIKEPITSPKKRLHDSLSSSDNSISSECDDPIEYEDDIVRATNDSCSNTTSSDSTSTETTTATTIIAAAATTGTTTIIPAQTMTTNSRTRQKKEEIPTSNNKHVSFDDKENINNPKIIDEMPAAVLKITYKFMNTETKLLKKIFVGHGLIEVEENQNFNILWTGIHMKPDILRNLTPYQRVNHFPRSYELTRKDRLYKNIEKMQHLRGFKHFDIVPQSFILPLEYKDLVTAHNKYRGPWIVKPAASSRGRGIFIVNSPEQIPIEEQVLVSKYISDPLCIDGHKCDLRVYVLVTSFDPLIIYVYEEGLVRLATVKYDRNAENLWNPCMHLCNYSINKYHSDYIKSRDPDDEDVGHKWTLSALLRHLKSQGCDTKQLMANIEDLIVKSMFACAQSIISACRMFVPNINNCFELYGFDILIDDTLKPWLLEINLSPSLGIDTPLDAKVKASLMTDLLTLIGVPAYSPLMRAHYDSKWTRYRNVNCRRTNSADHLNSSSGKKQANIPLTAEEARIVKSAKQQNARRGGFVRTYPTDDSMQRYGSFLDPTSGIPISTVPASGQGACSMILSHNYNQMLFNQLYNDGGKHSKENNFDSRMNQYERALETSNVTSLTIKTQQPKCVEEGKRLRKQIRKLIENGNELTQFQARQMFSHYLECILRRLTQDPRSCHEKLILKFVNRVSGTFKAPLFIRNPLNQRVISKDRSAMVAKLLGDYLESYNRDTEAYVDSFDGYGMISANLFNEFLSQAQESDLESILTLHTNLTQCMPFLYNRCGGGSSVGIPATPPIPTGSFGFLKALPSMAPGGYTRDQTKIDSFYKNVDTSEINNTHSSAVSGAGDTKSDKKIIDKTVDLKSVKKSFPNKKMQSAKT